MNTLDFSSAKTHRQLDKVVSDLLIMTRNDNDMTHDLRSETNKLIMKQYGLAQKQLPVCMEVIKYVD